MKSENFVSVKPVKVILGAHNGRSCDIGRNINHTIRYVQDAAKTWHSYGTQGEYNEWALKVVAGAMKNFADVLCVEEI